MEIKKNVALTSTNTLGCTSVAEMATVCATLEEFREAAAYATKKRLAITVLGGGSNVILRERVTGLVVLNQLKGQQFQPVDATNLADESTVSSVASQSDRIHLVLGSGESWDGAVRLAVGQGYRGLENLVLIPGSVGAAPIQNIGAYGAEIADTLVSVSALDPAQDKLVSLKASECRFGYRDSVFKHPEAASLIIVAVTLELGRSRPFKLGYADLQQRWEDAGSPPDPAVIAAMIEQLRRAKLPSPELIPNAGSFFKNPLVNDATFAALRTRFPDMVAYRQPEGWKLAAGWLIEKTGWKGRLINGCGCYEKQALVLINPGRQSASTVLAVADQVRKDVYKLFGVILEAEPKVID